MESPAAETPEPAQLQTSGEISQFLVLWENESDPARFQYPLQELQTPRLGNQTGQRPSGASPGSGFYHFGNELGVLIGTTSSRKSWALNLNYEHSKKDYAKITVFVEAVSTLQSGSVQET